MCDEFTCLDIHISMYGRRVYLCSCICLHICTPSLQVVYVFTYMQTEFACVCVNINIYTHGNYMFEGQGDLPPKWSIPKKKMAPRASVEGNPRSGAKLLNV